MHGVGILEGDICEGEVLVVGFDRVQDPEADYAGANRIEEQRSVKLPFSGWDRKLESG